MLCYFLCAEKRKNSKGGGLIVSSVVILPCEASLFHTWFYNYLLGQMQKRLWHQRATYSDMNYTPHFPLLCWQAVEINEIDFT